MQKLKPKIQAETHKIQHEFRNQILKYITTAFGLAVGLAWNDAIKNLIEFLFPLKKNTTLIKFFYAIIMTFILVIISVYLVRLLKREEKTEPDES